MKLVLVLGAALPAAACYKCNMLRGDPAQKGDLQISARLRGCNPIIGCENSHCWKKLDGYLEEV
jgi:hypothetical protein